MKKFISIFLIFIFILNLGGCSVLKSYSEEDLEQILEKALEEKYDEDFTVLNTRKSGASLYGNAYPNENPELLFISSFRTDGTIVYDEYFGAFVNEILKNMFTPYIQDISEEYFLTYTSSFNTETDKQIELIKDRNVKFEDIFEIYDGYFEEWGEEPEISPMCYLCINTSKETKDFEEEWTILENAYKQMEKEKLTVIIELVFVPEDMYKWAVDYLKTYSITYSDFTNTIEGYPTKKHHREFTLRLNPKRNPSTKEQYIEFRKGVD
jgi:hypothetical protein